MIAVINCLNENIDLLVKCLGDLKKEYRITISESEILRSDKIIFPDYGEASKAIGKLHLTNLFSFLKMCKKPMLGIGLGMQLMAETSKEGGNIPCLGIFPFITEKFDDKDMKIPFTGFNQVEITRSGGLFKGIDQNEKFYFANSYFLPINELTTSVAENKIKFSASIETGNYYAVQFHPEKSGDAGLRLLKNFIEL